VEAWGFEPKAEIVWQKLTKNGKHVFALGHYTRGSHETCVIATRGSVKPASKSIRSTFSAKIPIEPTGLFTKGGKPRFKAPHSAKPDEFFDLVEQLTGPNMKRLELFSRRNREGWTCLGDETGKRGTARRAP
jgi:N6-adenosine-specific RNA methylase IME4